MAHAPLPLYRRGFGGTMRRDAWWVQPLVVFTLLTSFVVYATWAAFQNAHYWYGPYLSPFYAPVLWASPDNPAGLEHAWFGVKPAWFPALVFLPFIADASATLVRRLRRGDRLYAAHRDHYYQRLNRLGAGHAGTLSIYATLMAGTTATALGCLLAPPAWGMVAFVVWCAVCFILFAAIDYHWRKNNPNPP